MKIAPERENPPGTSVAAAKGKIVFLFGNPHTICTHIYAHYSRPKREFWRKTFCDRKHTKKKSTCTSQCSTEVIDFDSFVFFSSLLCSAFLSFLYIYCPTMLCHLCLSIVHKNFSYVFRSRIVFNWDTRASMFSIVLEGRLILWSVCSAAHNVTWCTLQEKKSFWALLPFISCRYVELLTIHYAYTCFPFAW